MARQCLFSVGEFIGGATLSGCVGPNCPDKYFGPRLRGGALECLVEGDIAREKFETLKNLSR